VCGLDHRHSQRRRLSSFGVYRENGGETVSRKIRDEATSLIYQLYGWLKNVVEHTGQLLCAFRAVLHEFFRQAGKAAQVNEHGVGMQVAFEIPGAVVFLDKVWQEVFQNSIAAIFVGVKLRRCAQKLISI
jgi:hypothetical protein